MNLLTVNISDKGKRMLLDIAVYQYLKKDDSRSSDIINKINDIYGKEYLDLNGSIGKLNDFLSDSKYFATASNVFDNYEKLINEASIYGMSYIYSTSEVLNDLVNRKVKKLELFGNTEHVAIQSMIAKNSHDFSVENFDWEGTPLKLLANGVEHFSNTTGYIDNEDSVTTYSDLLVGNEGKKFFASELEVERVSHSDTLSASLMFDSEFYITIMGNIYEASRILFSDASNGKANLRELSSCILNYFQVEDTKMLQVEMLENTDKSLESLLNIDSELGQPYKKRVIRNAIPINVWDGRLSYRDPSYRAVNVGHEDNANFIYDVGMRVVERAVKLYPSGKSKNYLESIYALRDYISTELPKCISVDIDTQRANTRYRRLEQFSKYSTLLSIFRGIDSAIKLREILRKNGMSYAVFPCVEVRQNTWDNFSCLSELLNYFNIKEVNIPLDLNNLSQKYFESLSTNYSIKDMVVSKYNSTVSQKIEDALNSNLNLVARPTKCESKVSVKLTANFRKYADIFKEYKNTLENTEGITLVDKREIINYYNKIVGIIFNISNLFSLYTKRTERDYLDLSDINFGSSIDKNYEDAFNIAKKNLENYRTDLLSKNISNLPTLQYLLEVLTELLKNLSNSSLDINTFNVAEKLEEYLVNSHNRLAKDKILSNIYHANLPNLNNIQCLLHNVLNFLLYLDLSQKSKELLKNVNDFKEHLDFIYNSKEYEKILKQDDKMDYLFKFFSKESFRSFVLKGNIEAYLWAFSRALTKKFAMPNFMEKLWYQSVQPIWECNSGLYNMMISILKEIKSLIIEDELNFIEVDSVSTDYDPLSIYIQKGAVAFDTYQMSSSLWKISQKENVEKSINSKYSWLKNYSLMSFGTSNVVAVNNKVIKTLVHMDNSKTFRPADSNTRYKIYSTTGLTCIIPATNIEVNVMDDADFEVLRSAIAKELKREEEDT